VQPENGYYFDLVGRSSISKTGWMVANNIGIIDASYTGTVIVALVKIDPDAHEIELPCKLVQLIPRQLILMEPIEVDSLDDTERGDKGFGSSGK
jgi:dUTP pyrophosphatase